MVRIQALSMAIAGTICTTVGLGIAASSAQALTITTNFRVDITEGVLKGEHFGSIPLMQKYQLASSPLR